jgi:DNA invertase Pin-like site-specific DNA recombinase
MTAALYVRVSTAKKRAATPIGRIEDRYLQNTEVQLEPLSNLAASRGWATAMYQDRMSGATTNRPGYRQLLDDARRGKFQVVVVWRFDRFARSTKELVGALEEFRALGIDFVSHQEAIDTSTPTGKLMFAIIAAFAEFERCIIQERVRAGMEHARKYGTRSGAAIGRPKKIFQRAEAHRLQRAGVSVREIARRLKAGVGTVQRALKLSTEGL